MIREKLVNVDYLEQYADIKTEISKSDNVLIKEALLFDDLN